MRPSVQDKRTRGQWECPVTPRPLAARSHEAGRLFCCGPGSCVTAFLTLRDRTCFEVEGPGRFITGRTPTTLAASSSHLCVRMRVTQAQRFYLHLDKQYQSKQIEEKKKNTNEAKFSLQAAALWPLRHGVSNRMH